MQNRARLGSLLITSQSITKKYARKNALNNRHGEFCESGIRVCPESLGVGRFCRLRLRLREKQPTPTDFDSDSDSAALYESIWKLVCDWGRHRGLPQSPQHRGVGSFGSVSLLPTQGPPSILPAQRTGPTSTEGLLSAQGLLQSSQHKIPSGTEGPLSAQGLLPAAQGPPPGGTGPPLSGTRASFRHSGLPHSPQHRGVAPFGSVSLLPTQGPPSILSAQTTFRHRGPPLGGTGPPLSGTRASSRHRGLPQFPQHRGVGPFGIVSLLPTHGPPPILSAQTTFRHRGSPLGTGASSRRHRGLLSAVRGLLSAAKEPLIGIGTSLNPLSIEE